ncbi:hypothetical protein BKA93DRAFT_320388 [Sparassis latifolia]
MSLGESGNLFALLITYSGCFTSRDVFVSYGNMRVGNTTKSSLAARLEICHVREYRLLSSIDRLIDRRRRTVVLMSPSQLFGLQCFHRLTSFTSQVDLASSSCSLRGPCHTLAFPKDSENHAHRHLEPICLYATEVEGVLLIATATSTGFWRPFRLSLESREY